MFKVPVLLRGLFIMCGLALAGCSGFPSAPVVPASGSAGDGGTSITPMVSTAIPTSATQGPLLTALPGSVTPVVGTPVVPTGPQGSPTTAATPEGGLVVTLENRGQTLSLHVGDRFLLKLGETYDWTIDVANPAVLSRVPNITVIRGAQGVYETHQPGTTALTATGDPACRNATPPCGMPSILFQVTFVVQ